MIRRIKPYILSVLGVVSVVMLLSACVTTTQAQSDASDTAKAAFANANAEETKITKTIETYFEGWMTGDTTLLGKAMHRTCQLKNIKDDDVIIYDRATYLSFFKPRPRRENAGGQIVSINVTDDIASAKCQIHTKDRLYTDYFNMMKIKDTWYIVDKIANSKPRSSK